MNVRNKSNLLRGETMIKFTADTTCDLPKTVLEQHNISLIPLHILINDQDFKDGVDITPADIFRYVGEQKKECKTAAVNVYEYETFFEPFTKEYDAVIHFNIGSEFSSCHQNARIAASEYDNVYVIDSSNLSTGTGYLVLEAIQLANQGCSAQQICEQIEKSKEKIDASFVIDTLDYLYKGGRCSGVEAVGAALLKIKPTIEVVDGKMKVGKKFRGNFGSVVKKYVLDRFGNNENVDLSRLLLTHSACSPEFVANVKEQVEQLKIFEEVIIAEAGCTISSHCGPNTLGLMYKRK